MDERTQQIIEDSEKIRDRNRDLERELHGLKVENERLKEENEALFATQGGSDLQNLRDALKWLHDQGGIGAVYSLYKNVVIGEAEEALEVLYSEDIEKRPAPEVLDADGEEIRVGDKLYYAATGCSCNVRYINADGTIELDGHENRGWRADRFTRSAPVLAADGEPLEVGQTVYVNATGKTHHVTEVDAVFKRFKSVEQVDGSHWLDPMCFTHRAPVLAADGKPLREGETVYKLDDDRPYTLKRFDGEHVYINAGGRSFDIWTFPNKLTHERPDSWELLEEDAIKDDCEYFGRNIETCEGCPAYMQDVEIFTCDENAKDRDIVRRAKALAGVSE